MLYPSSMIGPETPLLLLLAGVALLLVGRRLFWLFVGLVGFFTVYRWFEPYADGAPSMRWVLPILAGVVGIVLAIFVQKVAVALAGFFAGGGFALKFLGLSLSHARGADLVIFLVAGVIAAILAIALFNSPSSGSRWWELRCRWGSRRGAGRSSPASTYSVLKAGGIPAVPGRCYAKPSFLP